MPYMPGGNTLGRIDLHTSKHHEFQSCQPFKHFTYLVLLNLIELEWQNLDLRLQLMALMNSSGV